MQELVEETETVLEVEKQMVLRNGLHVPWEFLAEKYFFVKFLKKGVDKKIEV